MEVSNHGEYSPSTSKVYIVGVYWSIEFIIVVTKGRKSQPHHATHHFFSRTLHWQSWKNLETLDLDQTMNIVW